MTGHLPFARRVRQWVQPPWRFLMFVTLTDRKDCGVLFGALMVAVFVSALPIRLDNDDTQIGGNLGKQRRGP